MVGTCTKSSPRRRTAGDKADQVADDAAAQRKNKVAALDTRRDHLLACLLEYAEVFGAFAGWNDHPGRRDRTDGKRGFERIERNASEFSSVTIATLAPGRKAEIRVPSDAMSSRPITMS